MNYPGRLRFETNSRSIAHGLAALAFEADAAGTYLLLVEAVKSFSSMR